MPKFFREHPKWSWSIAGFIFTTIFGLVLWRFPYNEEVATYSSIFDILDKISFEQSSLAKQNILINHYDEPIKDSGFIVDLKKEEGIWKDYIAADIAKNLDEDKTGDLISPIIECEFSKNWNTKFSTTDLPAQIEFTGRIPNESNYMNLSSITYSFGPTLQLEDCAILN